MICELCDRVPPAPSHTIRKETDFPMPSPYDCVARNGRLAVLLALLFLPGSAAAETIVIPSSNQDAFIQKNLPNRITGTKNTRLRVEAAPLDTKLKRSLVQFPLGSIPPGSTVTAAKVELYAAVNAQNPSLRHGLHRITAPWEETGVKWNNAPSFVATPTATAVVGDGRGFKAWDVTADVQAAITLCSSDHGWLVKDVAETATNDTVAYISREESHPADLGHRPHLTVTFDPPPCVTDADCADTNFCTTQEKCIAGTCVAQALECDDGNACTADVCDCSVGCRQQPICNDGLACTTDTCDPETQECTNAPVDDVCVTDCASGTCVGDPDAPDLDPNTGCFIDTTEPNGTPCNDGETCTTPDVCNGSGTCVPGPKDCDLPGCGDSPVCEERCSNCIDDDQDGLIDQLDPQCPRSDGAGLGLGDPKLRGKRLVRCQQSIRAAGTKFANGLRASLQKCSHAVFLCLQQKPGDAACLAKARARCAKQAATLQGGSSSLETRLGQKITKACGPPKPGLLPVVSGADLCSLTGLGFQTRIPNCQTPQSASLVPAVVATLADEHRCRTAQLFAADVPRAAELLAAGGIDTSALPCLATGANGNTLGLGKPAPVVKAVVKCQRGIDVAGARFVKQVLDAEQRCTEAVARCLQTKPGDAKCLGKAQQTCRKVTAKLYEGPKSREAKLKAAIARTCGSAKPGQAPRVALDDLRSVLGVGYDTLADDCAAYGVAGLASVADVSECLARQHVCRADLIHTLRTPRAQELLTIGGAVRP